MPFRSGMHGRTLRQTPASGWLQSIRCITLELRNIDTCQSTGGNCIQNVLDYCQRFPIMQPSRVLAVIRLSKGRNRLALFPANDPPSDDVFVAPYGKPTTHHLPNPPQVALERTAKSPFSAFRVLPPGVVPAQNGVSADRSAAIARVPWLIPGC